VHSVFTGSTACSSKHRCLSYPEADFAVYRPTGRHTVPTQQQQSFYSPLSEAIWVIRYQKKHSPTHHPDHHPIFISFFHLIRSTASPLPKLRAWQSFLHNLSPCPLWSTSWSGTLHLKFHTFLHLISVFFSHNMPIPSQPVFL